MPHKTLLDNVPCPFALSCSHSGLPDRIRHLILTFVSVNPQHQQDDAGWTGKDGLGDYCGMSRGTVCETQALHDLNQFNISQFQTYAIF